MFNIAPSRAKFLIVWVNLAKASLGISTEDVKLVKIRTKAGILCAELIIIFIRRIYKLLQKKKIFFLQNLMGTVSIEFGDYFKLHFPSSVLKLLQI